jgi:PhoPQ-activated pathogenicity-related protein
MIMFGGINFSSSFVDLTHLLSPDENYGWVEMVDNRIGGSHNGNSWVGYTLNVTSLRWLTDDDFSPSSQCKSVWWHYLVVIVPSNLKYTRNATLWITGGGVGDGPPHADSEDIIVAAALAMANGVIAGSFFQVRLFNVQLFSLILEIKDSK